MNIILANLLASMSTCLALFTTLELRIIHGKRNMVLSFRFFHGSSLFITQPQILGTYIKGALFFRTWKKLIR